MDAKTLDHVAVWVAARDSIAEFLVGRLGLHVIDRTDAFTLLGSDARRGKITLFAADGPRERGALGHVALRVRDLDGFGGEAFDLDEGLRIVLVEAAADVEYDLDHVALYSRDPEKAAEEYLSLGFEPAEPGTHGPRVRVGGAHVEFHPGDPGDPDRPLLNHLAVLVDSADEQRADAEELGLEIADFVDAPNTRALFVWGPERVKIEYVEHKPTFSLV
ncbi:MAG: VOC family protein [Actinomycetota bacterium]|nr:VOC family protein [Actinomycetota bacterium]